MRHILQLELTIPETAADIDEIHSAGAAAVMAEKLPAMGRAEEPEEPSARFHDPHCVPHSRGLSLGVVADAPTAEAAEVALRRAVTRITAGYEELAGWEVLWCRSRLDTRLTRRTVQEGAGISAALWHGGCAMTAADRRRARRDLRAQASRLRAFGAADFGVGEPEADGDPDLVELLAGSVLFGSALFFDELYHDLDILQRIGGTAADLRSAWLLHELPADAAHRIDIGFTRRWLLVAGTVAYRFLEPRWRRPACFAEALALRLMLLRAGCYLYGYGLLTEPFAHFARLEERALAPQHLRWLLCYSGEDGTVPPLEGPEFSEWFVPLDGDGEIHPYARVGESG